MHADLRRLGQPTASAFTDADRDLDFTSLAEYLDTRGASPLLRAVVDVAYTTEYGLEIDQQSCLNFLLFIHADRPSKFHPFVGNLFFAGEHTGSFYEQQGFMEGAVQSGQRAAGEVYRLLRR
jgi:Flavin containing amine oxidoreductase